MTDLSEAANLSRQVNARELIELLRDGLVAHLRTTHPDVQSLSLQYRGAGDSAQDSEYSVLEDVQPPRGTGAVLNDLLSVPSGDGHYDQKDRTFRYRTTRQSRSVVSVLDQLLELSLSESGLSGYWNGEGGEGRMTIDVKTGTLVLDHADFVVEEVRSVHRFAPINAGGVARIEAFLGSYPDPLTAPAELLRDLLHHAAAQGIEFDALLSFARSSGAPGVFHEADVDGTPCFG
jgi:hypothetical protein